MEIYADDLKYFEPDTENKTNVPESIEKVKNNEKDLKAQYIYQDSKLLFSLGYDITGCGVFKGGIQNQKKVFG